MSNKDFKPIYCTACGKLIWKGDCLTGFPTKLDPEPLTIAEEIIKRIQELRSYELHPTDTSFEASLRSTNRIRRSNQARPKTILASHRCQKIEIIFRMKGEEPSQEEVPDYWNRKREQQEDPEGIPF
jgi:hypothetical protein